MPRKIGTEATVVAPPASFGGAASVGPSASAPPSLEGVSDATSFEASGPGALVSPTQPTKSTLHTAATDVLIDSEATHRDYPCRWCAGDARTSSRARRCFVRFSSSTRGP